MKALTLTQPWAGLVASGIKLVENRPRKMIRRDDFGKRFAIHASRLVDDLVYDRIVDIDDKLADRDGIIWKDDTKNQPWVRLSRITSAVIAVAAIEHAVVEWGDAGRLVDACGANGNPVVDLGNQRRWFFGPIGYVLRDVHALPTPVPCRGWQGFWTLPHDIEQRVLEQLR